MRAGTCRGVEIINRCCQCEQINGGEANDERNKNTMRAYFETSTQSQTPFLGATFNMESG